VEGEGEGRRGREEAIENVKSIYLYTSGFWYVDTYVFSISSGLYHEYW
jgi:hypothetical protein